MDGAGPIAGDYNSTLASLIALMSFLKAVKWTWDSCVAFLFDICCEAIVWAGVVAGSLGMSQAGGDLGFAPHPSDYQIAAQRQGWTRSTSIVGSISWRESDGRLILSGWVYDKEYDEPLSVFAFVGGVFEPLGITKGAWDYVRTSFHLSPDQAKNVYFSGQVERWIDCETDSVVKIVAVNQRKQLAIIERLRVPGCGGALPGLEKNAFQRD
jgi:hypothetical protein